MPKRKAKAPVPKEEIRRLKFNGENGYPFIPGIPARDLEHHELIELTLSRDTTIDALTELLCSGTPGRTNAAGKALYSPAKPYVCPECKKEFTAWDKFHEHALIHVTENQEE